MKYKYIQLIYIYIHLYIKAVQWHPIHEDLVVSGGSDGSIMFWRVG